MALDPSLALRQAIVTTLKADAGLLAMVAAGQIFGEQTDSMPDRPFVRYGEDDAQPLRSSCWDGANVDFPVHSFSAEKFTDQVKGMNAAIAAALDGAVLDLGDGLLARVYWLGSQVIRDGSDPNAWHGIARFQAAI